MHLNNNNTINNDISTIISENGNLISRSLNIPNDSRSNENNLIINKNQFLSLLEFNRNEYNKNLGIDLDKDKNLQNIKENKIKSFHSDLNILHSDLFLFTKFENSRPYKLLEYIMSNYDSNAGCGANQYSNNNSNNNNNNYTYNNSANANNTLNNNSNNQFIHKNFLRSQNDKELYEEIKKTIFIKPKCSLTEPRTSIQKTLFQYIKSDFSNSNIIKIFEKCNSKIEKHFKPESNGNPFFKDKFTYQNILLEKLKENCNDDLLLEMNDNDMLKSLIYIVNRNNKVGYKFRKLGCSALFGSTNLNKGKEEKNENLITENLMTSEEININYINNNAPNVKIVNNNANNQSGFFAKTLTNNLTFLSKSLQDLQFKLNSVVQPEISTEFNKNIKEVLDLEIDDFEKNNFAHSENKHAVINCTANCSNNKTELLKRIKKALFNNNKNNSNDTNKTKPSERENNKNNKNEETKVSSNLNNESKKLKKFIYKKMRFLVNDDNKKTIALLKSLKNKEQNIKLFCKMLELFSKCREDDFEKIFKKMKDYLNGIDLDLAVNLDEILKSFNLENLENEPITNKDQFAAPNDIILNLDKDLKEKNDHLNLTENHKINVKEGIKENNIFNAIAEKKERKNQNENNELDSAKKNFVNNNYRSKKLSGKNNLIKELLNIKAFWVNFRLLFSMINILENKPESGLEQLTDEKFWRIIFNYIANKDYKIVKTKLKKIKKGKEKDLINITELSENKESLICYSSKKNKAKNTEVNQDSNIKNENENAGIAIRKRKYIRKKLKNNHDINNSNNENENENNIINKQKNEIITNSSANNNSNIFNQIIYEDKKEFKNEFFRNSNKDIFNNNINQKIQASYRKLNLVKADKVNKTDENNQQQQFLSVKKSRKNRTVNNPKNTSEETEQPADNAEKEKNLNNNKKTEEEDSESEIALIDDECKDIILNRIKEKIPLFDIFKSTGELAKRCFSNFTFASKRKRSGGANKTNNKRNTEKAGNRNTLKNEGENKKSRGRERNKNINNPKEAGESQADKPKSNRKKVNETVNDLFYANEIVISENNKKSEAHQDIFINLVSSNTSNKVDNNIYNFSEEKNNLNRTSFIEKKEIIKCEISSKQKINPFNSILLNNLTNKAFINNNNVINNNFNNNIKNEINTENDLNEDITVSDLSEAQTNSNLKITKQQQQIKIKGNVIINNYYNIFPTGNITDASQILNNFGCGNPNSDIFNNSASVEKSISNKLNNLHNILNQNSSVTKVVTEKPVKTEPLIVSANKRSNKKNNLSNNNNEEANNKLNSSEKKGKSENIFNVSAENLILTKELQEINLLNENVKEAKQKNEANSFSTPKQQRNTRSVNKLEDLNVKLITRTRRKKNELTPKTD